MIKRKRPFPMPEMQKSYSAPSAVKVEEKRVSPRLFSMENE